MQHGQGFHDLAEQGWIVVCSLFLFCFNGIDGGNQINIIWCLKSVLQKWLKRLGIKTLQNLKARAFVFESIRGIMNNEKLGRRLDKCLGDGKKVENYVIPLDVDWELERTMLNDETLCLDAMIFENIVWFLNHRCEDANLLDMLLRIETHHQH